MLLHPLYALQRLERTNQYAARNSFRLAGHIQHKMRTIVKEHVGVSRMQIHRPNPRRRPAKMMSGRITRWISLSLDNSSAQSSASQLMNHNFADQEPRQLHRVMRQLRAPQSPNFELRNSRHKGNPS